MLTKLISGRLQLCLGVARRLQSCRRAGIALMVALSMPMLIGFTGLAVDVGYWYQQQEALQSAADAAALAAANAQLQFGLTTTTAAMPFAVGAANAATNKVYSFTNANISLTLSTSTVNTSAAQWLATATAPRPRFFSAVYGMGLSGVPNGNQVASAAADDQLATAPACLIGTGTTGPTIVSAGGGGKIVATNCAIYSASTSCSTSNSAIDSTSGNVVEAPTVEIASGGCAYATGGGSYVGTTSGYTYSGGGTTAGVTAATTAPSYPSAPSVTSYSWPTLPAEPTLTPTNAGGTSFAINMATATNATSGGPATHDAWVNDSTSGSSGSVDWSTQVGGTTEGNCVNGSSGNDCYFNGGATITNMNNIGGSGSYANVHSLTLNYSLTNAAADNTGVTILNSGLPTNSNLTNLNIYGAGAALTGGTTTNGGSVGQMNYSGTITTNPGTGNTGTYEFNNEFQFQGGSSASMSFGAGNYYLYNASNDTFYYNWSSASNVLNTTAGSSYYINGTIRFGTAGTFNFASGSLYEFQDTSLSSSAQTCNPNSTVSGGQGRSVSVVAGVTLCDGTFNFNGGTYFLNGGIYTVNGGTNVYFGPGIYYVENGTLDLWGANSIVAQGATFVLGPNASVIVGSSSTLSLAAPDDITAANTATGNIPANDPNYDPNCVEPSTFSGTNLSTWPYGGTGGHGICGVLFYQTNSLPDLIEVNGTGYLNGLIYSPNAVVDFTSGNGTVEASTASNTSQTLEIEASEIYDPSTTIKLSSSASGSSSSSSPLSSMALLVQ